MNARHQDLQKRFIAEYRKLSILEKGIAQVCAIIGEPVSSKTVRVCLLRSNLEFLEDRLLSTQIFNDAIENLQRLGILDDECRCHDSYIEIIARYSLHDNHFKAIVRTVRSEIPAPLKTSRFDESKCLRYLREIRIGFYSQNIGLLHEYLHLFNDCREILPGPSPMVRICNNPFDGKWFQTLPVYLQFHALIDILRYSLSHLLPVNDVVAYLNHPEIMATIPEEGRPSFYYLIVSQLLLDNQFARADEIMKQAGDLSMFGLYGWVLFLQGDLEHSVAAFDGDLKKIRQANDQKKAFFTGIEGLFYVLSSLKSGDISRCRKMKEVYEALVLLQPHNGLQESYSLLLGGIEILEGEDDLARIRLEAYLPLPHLDAITTLFVALLTYWLDGALPHQIITRLDEFFHQALHNGYRYLAKEYAELLVRCTDDNAACGQFLDSLSGDITGSPLVDVIRPEEQWRRALNALNSAASRISLKTDMKKQKALLSWFIHHDGKTNIITASPKIQKLTARGKWTKGRSMALKKLYCHEKLSFLSEEDIRVCKAIVFENDQWGGSYRLDMDRALPALIGHPHIFSDENPKIPMEFTRGEPELQLQQVGNFLELGIYPHISGDRVVPVREAPNRFRIFEIAPELQAIVDILDDKGLHVPLRAKEDLLRVVSNLSRVITVHSGISGSVSELQKITADPSICIHLLPIGQGFRLAMYVKPFSKGDIYLKPAQGTRTVISEVDGIRFHAVRNLALEEKNAQSVIDQCPSLKLNDEKNFEWLLDDPEDCLQILLELNEILDQVIIEWPEGQKISVSHHVSPEKLHLCISSKPNWFEITGEIILDDTLVLDMQQLIRLAGKNPGRFIPLGDGRFLSLTEEFRKIIGDLDHFSEPEDGKIRLNPLTAIALNDLHDCGIHFRADKTWYEHLDKISQVNQFTPLVPSTFRAEMRPYQVEGFQWLARLAFWGVGGCLADDMGLGKTIQTLAIMVNRAANGPTLVVAPTSVCQNWLSEANRFAPTLNMKILGGKDRNELVGNLSAYDVLVTSYSLLQQEIDILTSIQWEIIVLDEAQAIKNMATKRSKAAMSLGGRFKLITTGTPIENHLGELWNLFNFINPGLLGSLATFNKRYAMAIERKNDSKARYRLKKLISPFILRRMKSQVLEELPPRTEIVLHVELSPEEIAFYEALRQDALTLLASQKDSGGKKHVQVLVEIMKLRRACCNPKLVVPNVKISSSKLELFHEVVDELLQNRHKALVFSQFVGHLAIIRKSLDKRGIPYQYLDGSVPSRDRSKIVEDFQSGQGDLFLISLKAGGVGLNLTAADYVIHMDPWWNPAVEDQASDRAHRIGQVRPVTVYRLVCKNTIEEKIVDLHNHKRDLADSLLEGADISGKISTEDLFALIEETAAG